MTAAWGLSIGNAWAWGLGIDNAWPWGLGIDNAWPWGMAFDNAWLLWALPLALLPLRAAGAPALANTWLAGQVRDRPSRALAAALLGAEMVALAALIVAGAGPHLPEHAVPRTGQGAEIVLVLDRSRSMDQGFSRSRPPAAARGTGPEALDYYTSQSPGRLRESKTQAAHALLADFTASRPDDRFAMVVFSTLPIRVLGFTGHNAAVQAAIGATQVGRGLSETHIGRALDAALALFDGRPYNGSRIVMLVSDGGDRLDPETRERLARRLPSPGRYGYLISHSARLLAISANLFRSDR